MKPGQPLEDGEDLLAPVGRPPLNPPDGLGEGGIGQVYAALGDAMRGDPTLFNRQDTVEAAWRVIDPVLGNVTPLYEYEPHTWGPAEADTITANIGGWHNPGPCENSPTRIPRDRKGESRRKESKAI